MHWLHQINQRQKRNKILKRGYLQSQFDCHIVPIAIGIIGILAIRLIAFNKLSSGAPWTG